ncbi:hypothetical protein L1887_33176 [Cichorium endivia]|nr:hypothetical protein L1887_33176 [Cichorium endivia]
MDASSVRNLCRHLISSAIQRCRMSGELCRLSVSLKSSPLANPTLVRISISDTGVGSCLEEFQDVKNLSDSSMNQIHAFLCLADGIISIATTNAHYEDSFGIELIVDKAEFTDDQCVNVIVVNECIDLPSEANAEYLKLGLVDYVLKHGNQIDSTCNSCFPIRDHLKIGSGEVCKSYKNTETKIEAVVIISELSEMMDSSCFRACDNKTEVLYFNDFSHGLISQSLLKALETVDWKSYGLSIKSISDEEGCCVTVGRNLVKKALKLALSDLKEKNAGVLLSAHAVKIRSYAPDLAKTIAGLISGSNDLNFKGECASLLGLHSHDAESIEDNIKQRLTSIIDQNDREPQTTRTREFAPLLFNDDCFEEPEFAYEEYEDGEVSFSDFDV